MAIASVSARLPERDADHGPGLWARTFRKPDGAESEPVVTNIRVAGSGRKPGAVLINFAAILLFLLGVGLLGVSLAAQYAYLLRERHQPLASIVEAGAMDLGLIIFSLLALGLARAGKSAKIERALVVACAAGSALMNYAASQIDSPRSVLAFIMPPIFLAVVTDRVVVTVRRHVLGMNESRSPWSVLGRVAMYSLRLVLAPISTAGGARRYVLECAPVREPARTVAEPAPVIKLVPPEWPPVIVGPVAPVPTKTELPPPPKSPKAPKAARTIRNGAPSKSQAFIDLVVSERGPLAQIPLTEVYGLAKQYSPKVGLDAGSARTKLRASIIKAQNGGAK